MNAPPRRTSLAGITGPALARAAAHAAAHGAASIIDPIFAALDEYQRLYFKRNRTPAGVSVVIRVAFVNVKVRAAKAYAADLDEDFMRVNRGDGNGGWLHLVRSRQCERVHV